MPTEAPAPTARRLGGYVLSLGSAEILGRGLSFVAIIVVARVLGPESFGRFALAQAIVLYLAALGDGGLTLWTQREIVRRPAELSRLIAQTLVAQVLLAVAAMSVLAVIALAAPVPDDTAVLILAAAPTALAQAVSTVYALQALEWMRAAAVVKVVTQLVAASLAIALALLTANPVVVIMTMWSGLLAGAVLALAVLVRRAGLRAQLPSWAQVGTTLRAGLPILGAIALVHYSQLMDTLVLGVLRGSHETGVYAAAARLMVVAAVVAMVLANAVYPEMVRRHSVSTAELGVFSGRLLAVTLRVSLVAAVVTAALAPVIIDLLYDARFAASADVLRVLALLMPVLCVNSIGTQVLMAAGLRRRLLAGVSIGAAVASVAIPLATLAFGGVGTAVALVGAMATQCLAFSWLARGPVTTGWARLLGGEIALGLVPFAAIIALGAITAAPPAAAVALALAVAVGIEAARGWPTAALLAPRLPGRRRC
ncbi:oligosaccharide flippase family protein [Haloechinothrix halophila]|uniref:oligosaccharide flippase family protein n=1 Tax=Haloechinothrix halophila TaxID=1069073 RepID=UPI0003FB1058|nr:oligosaccharide flippase family protein [Haloechinothrix halophila]